MSYATVVLSDSEVTFSGAGEEDVAFCSFPYCVLLINILVHS